jgi:hypothetical protein
MGGLGLIIQAAIPDLQGQDALANRLVSQLFDQLSAAANARLFRDEAAQKPKPFRYR